jgi:hypothetical protein
MEALPGVALSVAELSSDFASGPLFKNIYTVVSFSKITA